MKKYFILCCFYLLTIGLYSQDRVDKPKLVFDQTGIILNNITGWAYDQTVGEWVSYQGLIDNRKDDARYMWGSMKNYMMSKHYNNINSLQFKTLLYNNVQYYILIWDKWEGAYEYPSIQEDWEEWQTKYFLMFTSEDIKKLQSLTNEPIILYAQTPYRSRYTNASDEEVIQSDMDRYCPNKTYLIIYKATNSSIRFMFKNYFAKDSDIEQQYFEISEQDYLNLINITF